MQHLHRFICPTDIEGPPWLLSPEDARHAAQVLRLKSGDAVQLMDGKGKIADVTLTILSAREVVAEPSGPVRSIKPPEPRWHLLLGAPEMRVLEEIVEHAVELGVWKILAAISDRSQIRCEALQRRSERLEKIVRSAGKQSGNPFFPAVEICSSLSAAIASAPLRGFLLSQGAEASLHGQLHPGAEGFERAGDITLAFGPEGDFTPAESDLLIAHGLVPASLGPNTLRVETAALAALAIAQAAGG